jgi:glutamate--cysteine ligase regulatory subunit
MTIPAREAIVQEPAVRFSETREALDVTAKFFYLPSASAESAHFDPAWIQESLEHLKTATGLTDIDTFIISFPGLQFAECPSNCENTESTIRQNGTAYPPLPEDDLRKQIEDVWRAASANKHLKSLGVSEFSLERLKWLFEQSGENATKGVVTSPSGLRKPRVGQVNTRHSCDVPQDLIEFAKTEDLELLVHSDCSGGHIRRSCRC